MNGISLGRILCSEFDKTTTHPSDRDGIVEIEYAGIGWLDMEGLDAGLREDGHLRFDGNVQSIEKRGKVAVRPAEWKLGFPLLDTVSERSDRIFAEREGRTQNN
jgi:hypothetical protein